ncbi:hypothetical protein [Gordonia terrae]
MSAHSRLIQLQRRFQVALGVRAPVRQNIKMANAMRADVLRL